MKTNELGKPVKRVAMDRHGRKGLTQSQARNRTTPKAKPWTPPAEPICYRQPDALDLELERKKALGLILPFGNPRRGRAS